MNIWFDAVAGRYNIYYDGKRYTRTSYIAAKELIDDLLCNMVAVEMNNIRKVG